MPHRALIAQQIAAMYSTLSHPVRISIIVELREGELCVNSLQDILGIRQSAVSQHLALLKSQRLIKERRDGRNILYRLASPELATWLIEGIPLIVPDDSESNLLKSAAQRAISHWSGDKEEEVRSKATRGK